jgi:tagaturonate reductase
MVSQNQHAVPSRLQLLSRSLLHDLLDRQSASIELPPRALLTAPETILQFGSGKFLRGFIEDFVQIANAAGTYSGRIVTVQRDADHRSEAAERQDHLYTLILRGMEAGGRTEAKRIIASISRTLVAGRDWDAVIAAGSKPQIRVIVSNATEAGLALDPADTPGSKPPRSFLGKLTLVLVERWRSSAGHDSDVAVIPCELVQNNGPLLQRLILDQSRAWNLPAAFAAWFQTSVHVASTLVDRIVVGTPRRDLLEAEWGALGYRDDLLDIGEPFYLLAMEADAFVRRHFPLDTALPNVQFVDDLQPYRMRKLRILNGPHMILAPIGRLLGLETVLQAMGDAQLGSFVEEAIFKEIIPAMDPEDEAVNAAYGRQIIERFRNPAIEHKLLGICAEITTKTGIRLFPTIRDHLRRRDALPERTLLALAAMMMIVRDPNVQDTHAGYIRDRWKSVELKSPQSFLAFTSDILANQAEWCHEPIEVSAAAPKVADLLHQTVANGLREVLGRTEYNCIVR